MLLLLLRLMLAQCVFGDHSSTAIVPVSRDTATEVQALLIWWTKETLISINSKSNSLASESASLL